MKARGEGGESGKGSDARLLNMTDRSLGNPSKCTRSGSPTRPSGGCWVSRISYRRKPTDAARSPRPYSHRLCLRNMQRRWKMPENTGWRFYVPELSNILKIVQAPASTRLAIL